MFRNFIKIFKGGTLMEKVFRQAKEIPHDILHDGHRIENATKCAGLVFLIYHLG